MNAVSTRSFLRPFIRIVPTAVRAFFSYERGLILGRGMDYTRFVLAPYQVVCTAC